MKTLRREEEFVISTLAKAFSGSWIASEVDPPDAFLILEAGKIAVEISTLNQHVYDADDRLVPRRSHDMTALSICDELNEELRNCIQDGKRVRLFLESPINKPQKLKSFLARRIRDELKACHMPSRHNKESILGNRITFQVIDQPEGTSKKLLGLVSNRRSNQNILVNAIYVLEDRIRVKDKKCKSSDFYGPFWLALLNWYWIADVKTYEQAMEILTISHRFDRILIVSDDASVATLYPRPQS